MREKLDKDGEGGPGQARCLVSDKQSRREEKSHMKGKENKKPRTGDRPQKGLSGRAKQMRERKKVLFERGVSPFPSRAGT